MRRPLIAGNWKMNTTVGEAVQLVEEMKPGLEAIGGIDKLICPPFVSLAAVGELIKGSSVKLGAQNLYFAEKGAYTGEVSPAMVADLCEFVIIGHSERRQYFGEDGALVSKKIKAALSVGLKPIACIGESLADNEAGKTEAVLSRQLSSSLEGITGPDGLVIAYEPVWAIGTGKAATTEQANRTIGFIRRGIAGLYGDDIAQQMRILYGGSVNAENAAEYMSQPEIDGALVGGASLKAVEFLGIAWHASVVKGVK
ncbi:triose-phosphate isomerase [Chloroflexota bacterium]